MRQAFCLSVVYCAVAFALPPLPKLIRVYPLGGQAGTSVRVELLGDLLANTTGVKFDCDHLVWTQTTQASHGRLAGVVKIAPEASLGPHLLRATTLDGESTSLLFNVGQFPSVVEAEPNNQLQGAQEVTRLPAELQGRLDGAPDLDNYAFAVQAGERWLFDLKAIEHGSAVEARMILLDSDGRQLQFNDDRGDFDENPRLDHTFERSGKYFIKVDQYRGPRGFNFGKNCAYILRISQLPVVGSVSPLGLTKGKTSRLRITGSSLDGTKSILLTKLRHAEYARMTYPYTMPIDFLPDPPSRARSSLAGKILSVQSDAVEAELTIPAGAATGLWKLWVTGPHGVAEGLSLEISEYAEYNESTLSSNAPQAKSYALNGALSKSGEVDVYRIEGLAGQPLHLYTLAAQLGVSYLDTVLRLRDASGKKLAENDDVVAGQGTLIGNPDSSLYFTPQSDGPLFVEVFDRLKRGGSGYDYRLKVSQTKPGFQLFTTPENFVVPRQGSGEIKVHLVRDVDFEGEVSVWLEGLPPGMAQPKGTFRADQLFEPNADGADMIIPEITFKIEGSALLTQPSYTLRVKGCATREESKLDRRLVEGHTAVMLGPLLDVWNFTRRPLPLITMTVVESSLGKLLIEPKTIRLEQGKTAEFAIQFEDIPQGAKIDVRDLPKGARARSLGRKENRETVVLEAEADAEPGNFAISVESSVTNRRVSTPATLTVHGPS